MFQANAHSYPFRFSFAVVCLLVFLLLTLASVSLPAYWQLPPPGTKRDVTLKHFDTVVYMTTSSWLYTLPEWPAPDRKDDRLFLRISSWSEVQYARTPYRTAQVLITPMIRIETKLLMPEGFTVHSDQRWPSLSLDTNLLRAIANEIDVPLHWLYGGTTQGGFIVSLDEPYLVRALRRYAWYGAMTSLGVGAIVATAAFIAALNRRRNHLLT